MSASFKMPKRNFRQRKRDTDSEDEENGKEVDDTLVSVTTKVTKPSEVKPIQPVVKLAAKTGPKSSVLKSGSASGNSGSKSNSSSTVSKLSFADFDEGDTEEFQVKRSSHSKKVVNKLKKEKKREEEEKLKAKQQKQQSQAAQPLKAKAATEAEKGSEKKGSGRQEGDVLNGDDARDTADRGSDEEGKHKFRAMLQSGEIPDANMIHMIRKRRQLAREAGDFVPLDDTQRADKTNDKSRLVRDDDNDRSEEEDDEPVSFAGDRARRDIQKYRDDFLAAQHGSDSEGSETEMSEWEKRQIFKGLRATQVQDNEGDGSPYYGGFYTGGQMNLAPPQASAPPPSAPIVTLEQLRADLKSKLDGMTEVSRAHAQELETLKVDEEECRRTIRHNTQAKPELEAKYKFFQEMRGYVRDLVECLNEKVPLITTLENRMMKLWADRAKMITERRRQDVKDEAQESLPGKSVSRETILSEAWRRRKSERSARRARRARARAAKSQQQQQHYEGTSTDDEVIQSQTVTFDLERDRVLGDKTKVFEDTVEDFCQIALLQEQLCRWSGQDKDSYSQAYVPLCLPGLASPLVRFQMVDWNPIEADARELESFPWFNAMMLYNVPEDGDQENGREEEVEDQEEQVVSAVVEKTVLPKLCVLVEKVWDPMSSCQTRRLIALVSKLVADFPTLGPDSKNTKRLLECISAKMKTTVDEDVYVPLYPKTALENKSSPSGKFFQRQCWSAIKVLRTQLLWHAVLSPTYLQETVLGGVLNRYLMLGLLNSPADDQALLMVSQIVEAIPEEWVLGCAGGKTLPQLEKLCGHMMQLALGLDRCAADDGGAEAAKTARAQIKRVARMLVKLEARDHATTVAKTYDLKLTAV